MKNISKLVEMFSTREEKEGDDQMAMKGKIIVVLDGDEKGRRVFETENIITNAGDIFYAQMGAGETPTEAFVNLYLGSTGTPSTGKNSNYGSITPIAGTEKSPSSGYPKANCTDADNTGGGANVVTWRYAYAKADFDHAAITEGIISRATASGTDPVLCHFAFAAAFEKTSNDTLTIFVNHTCLGS